MTSNREKRRRYESKIRSIQKIEKVLEKEDSGLQFNELKRMTNLHQGTLSRSLKELVKEGIVKKDNKKYSLSRLGIRDLAKKELSSLITSSSGYSVVSGPGRPGSSAYVDEDVIMHSTGAFALPSLSLDVMKGLILISHKYWMLKQLIDKIENESLFFENEKSIRTSIDRLLKTIKVPQQVLAFTINIEELKKKLKDPNVRSIYSEEILRVARIENKNNIEKKRTPDKLRKDLL